jgi:hypothetical protein
MGKRYKWAALGMSLLLFFGFKQFYTNPNMVMDSYVYIKGAVLNLQANSFPIGYSKLLQAFCFFSRSANLLVFLQYSLLQSASLSIFLSVLYIFSPSKPIAIILFVFLFCNPLILFLSNFIMSDTVFTALSLFWLTNVIWIVYRPRPYMLWTQAVLLLAVFTVRYNALYYPIVASAAILICQLRIGYKIAGLILPFVMLAAFVNYTSNKMQELTGVRQFSPFGGWQLGNNALYMYGHIYHQEKDRLPARFQDLDTTVRDYFDATHHTESLINNEIGGGGAYYVANYNSPLITFMNRKYGADTIFQNFRKWGPMGYLCGQYGSCLIKTHPFAFVKYWIWPNSQRYFLPPAEVFQMYSPYYLRDDEFGQMAKQLFDLQTLAVPMPLINFRTALLSTYPLFFTLLNLFFIMSYIGFFALGAAKTKTKMQVSVFITIALLWLCNAGFSITASSIVLRYQIFIMIVQFVFGLILADTLYRDNRNNSPANG